jgi:2-polyprenyl-6-methoxyphenol hydroxylase-like FAD-dependent oxidoreductase
MRVLISGGGIAGPALAYWLHRHGIDTTVVERARGPRPGGHAVDVRGAARDVVEWMGLMPTVRENRVDERGIAFVNGAGRRTAAMPADLFGGEGIVAEIEIARGDLARILYESTAPHTRYLFDDRITALHQDADGVDVTFAGGGGDRFDVVVGADGVHSAVRSLAFGPEAEFVKFLGAYTAYFTVPDPGDLNNWVEMYNAPGGRVATVRPERGGTAKASLSFTIAEPAYERATPAEQRRALADRLTGAGWRVPSILAAMPDAPDFYFDSVSQVKVDRWWRGRTVLIGDAGYCGSPLAGLGTSMSLVGAYVLAGELATAADPGAAFAAYQQEMAAYVAAGLELPPGGVKGYAPQTALMIRMRSLSMGMMNHWPMRQMIAKQFQKADAITLKAYASVNPVPGRETATS